jgi:hypothetical protein
MLDERRDGERRLRYRPTYPTDWVLLGILVGGVLMAAVVGWWVVRH